MELCLAWLQAATSIVDSNLRSKGKWRFWFELYRPLAMSWNPAVVARNIALNMATVIAMGHGAIQLVLAAVIYVGFVFRATHLTKIVVDRICAKLLRCNGKLL